EFIYDKNIAQTIPLDKNDIVLCFGAYTIYTHHKTLFEIKKPLGFKFVQMIYDFTPILIPHMHKMATVKAYPLFLEYVNTISDCLLYGGVTAMRDGLDYQKMNNLPSPSSHSIKFGSDFRDREIDDKKEKLTSETEKHMLREIGIKGRYILMVGTFECRKNHITLYKAYIYLIEQGINPPQLVLSGHMGWKFENTRIQIANDKRLKDRIIFAEPTDLQLDLLYRRCMFTVLPTLYEGWSLTLPESFRYGKLCIASNVAPLIETGGDFAEYVHPYDVVGWADKILYYTNHKQELKRREQKIRDEYKPITWEECAKEVVKHIQAL
ncbi:MAG: glycosyltransferase, partial [Campylobacteraceae bacterium]|nr:glycosyltransferase [Campylobacteraceae bacterium]